MSVLGRISKQSRNGYDEALLNCICENYDQIEFELNGKEYKEPEEHNSNFCTDCNLELTMDYQKCTLVYRNYGLCEYYPAYVASYNYMMQPLKRKCVYKRSDNFKVILNQLFYGGKQFVPDDVMNAIKNETHNKTDIVYNYEIPLTIPILECILKTNKMMKYKNSIYCILFKLSNQSFPRRQQKNTI